MCGGGHGRGCFEPGAARVCCFLACYVGEGQRRGVQGETRTEARVLQGGGGVAIAMSKRDGGGGGGRKVLGGKDEDRIHREEARYMLLQLPLRSSIDSVGDRYMDRGRCCCCCWGRAVGGPPPSAGPRVGGAAGRCGGEEAHRASCSSGEGFSHAPPPASQKGQLVSLRPHHAASLLRAAGGSPASVPASV